MKMDDGIQLGRIIQGQENMQVDVNKNTISIKELTSKIEDKYSSKEDHNRLKNSIDKLTNSLKAYSPAEVINRVDRDCVERDNQVSQKFKNLRKHIEETYVKKTDNPEQTRLVKGLEKYWTLLMENIWKLLIAALAAYIIGDKLKIFT
jgi:predicted transcriptional regulator